MLNAYGIFNREFEGAEERIVTKTFPDNFFHGRSNREYTLVFLTHEDAFHYVGSLGRLGKDHPFFTEINIEFVRIRPIKQPLNYPPPCILQNTGVAGILFFMAEWYSVDNSREADTYISICKDMGKYRLTTRQVFNTADQAEEYNKGTSSSRDPLVIPGDFKNLRFN